MAPLNRDPIVNPLPPRPTPTPEIPDPVQVGGQFISRALYLGILDHAQHHGHAVRVLPGTNPSLARGCARLMATAGRDPMASVDALGEALDGFMVVNGVQPRPFVDKSGSPSRDGCEAALRGAARGLSCSPPEQLRVDITPQQMEAHADRCAFLFGVELVIDRTAIHLNNYLVPVARGAVADLRLVCGELEAGRARTLGVAIHMEPAYEYLKDATLRAQDTRRRNAQTQAEAGKRAEEKVGAEARVKARGEALDVLNDAVVNVLTKDSKDKK